MDYYKLFMIMRVILAFVVLFYLPIPMSCKLLLIVFFDNVDGRFPKRLKIHNYDHTLTKQYQIHDKIADLLGYCIIMYYLYKKEIFPMNKLIVLFGLLIYRLIGDIIFFVQKNRKVLFYFPNIFEMLALYWAILYDIQKEPGKGADTLIIIAIVLFKTYHEYFLHFSDDNHANFKPFFGDFLKGNVPVKTFMKKFKKDYIY